MTWHCAAMDTTTTTTGRHDNLNASVTINAVPAVELEIPTGSDADTGHMFISEAATPAETRAGYVQVDAAGWEPISEEESGDLHDLDGYGRMVVPLARKP